jgi:hypothetical protein
MYSMTSVTPNPAIKGPQKRDRPSARRCVCVRDLDADGNDDDVGDGGADDDDDGVQVARLRIFSLLFVAFR